MNLSLSLHGILRNLNLSTNDLRQLIHFVTFHQAEATQLQWFEVCLHC